MNTEDDEFARIVREQALNKMADNARELGLDYEPAQQEPVAWIVEDQSGERLEWASDAHSCHGVPTFPLYTSPPPQRTWVDPNDKTQKQYLPHIGEPVLFCHKGMTYMGKHTGGSFQSEVTNQYFNTWECHWMYLPAAHGIKE